MITLRYIETLGPILSNWNSPSYWTSSILFPVCFKGCLHFWKRKCENAEWIGRLEFHMSTD